MIAGASLQAAIFGLLNGNVTGGVYDEVPPSASLPYTVIGEGTERPDDSHTEDASQETVTLHTWDNATGTVRTKRIMAEIDDALHRKYVTLADGGRVYLKREFAEVLKDEAEAGRTWRHAVMRYRAYIQEAE